MYFPTDCGTKEPQNLENQRVVKDFFNFHPDPLGNDPV